MQYLKVFSVGGDNIIKKKIIFLFKKYEDNNNI